MYIYNRTMNNNDDVKNSKYACKICRKEYKDNSRLLKHQNKGNCEKTNADINAEARAIHDKLNYFFLRLHHKMN